jgi:hypothetical protein
MSTSVRVMPCSVIGGFPPSTRFSVPYGSRSCGLVRYQRYSDEGLGVSSAVQRFGSALVEPMYRAQFSVQPRLAAVKYT